MEVRNRICSLNPLALIPAAFLLAPLLAQANWCTTVTYDSSVTAHVGGAGGLQCQYATQPICETARGSAMAGVHTTPCVPQGGASNPSIAPGSQQQMLMNGAAMVGNAVGQELGKAIFGDPQAEAAAQAAQAQAAAQAKARAEAEAQRTDQVRDRLLGQMQGVVTSDRSDTLPLMGTTTGTGTGTNFFGKGNGGIALLHDDGGNGAASAAPPQPASIAPDGAAVSVGGVGLMSAAPDAHVSATPTRTAAASGPTKPSPAPANAGGDGLPVVGMGTSVPLIPRAGDPEHLAAGQRYVDCNATRKAYLQLKSGMATQSDWLMRAKARLDDQSRERRKLDQEQKVFMVKTLFELTKDLSLDMGMVKQELEAGRLAQLSPERQEQVHKALETLSTSYDAINKWKEAYAAGHEFGEKMQEGQSDGAQREGVERLLSEQDRGQGLAHLAQLSRNLLDSTLAAEKLLVDSGLAEEGGKELAKDTFGPLGTLAFTAAKIGVIDVPEAAYNDYLTTSELNEAYLHYDELKHIYDDLQERIANDHADLVQYCRYEG